MKFFGPFRENSKGNFDYFKNFFFKIKKTKLDI